MVKAKNTEKLIDKKVFIPVRLGKYRVIGMLDSGAGLTLMQHSLFKRLGMNESRLSRDDIPELKSFSDSEIYVVGQARVNLRLYPGHAGISIGIWVIQDIPGSPDLLLGADLMSKGQVQLGFSNTDKGEAPTVRFLYPEDYSCTVIYAAPSQLCTVRAYVSLGPSQEDDIEVTLHPGAMVIRTDIILVSASQLGSVAVVPSRTELIFDSRVNAYTGTARVINLTNRKVEDLITCKMELINNYQSIEFSQSNRAVLCQALYHNPLGREVLPESLESCYGSRLLTVNSLSIDEDVQVPVNDWGDLSDTIHAKEPTFTGTAETIPEIIEPAGLDIPTIVYSNAAEAIRLSDYPEVIREYVQKIFIEKYPEVVSLHSLDAGNLSLTLGYTQLRLREGEVLPKAKRIFHVSPSERRHMDDLCDLLIKFGYITRSPMQPSGHHLYGMSSYLVPRAKPNCLGRLIVDFSPVNQLIESPASVVPEMSATLQFLQGKAFFSSIDLRYAYLGLRIDEASRPLTTFLTPSGSFQWLALPTGAANSPAYFIDAIHKILHYEPVYGEDGKVIYESENVVKLKRSDLETAQSYFDDIINASHALPTYQESIEYHFEMLEKVVSRLAFHGAKISVPKCEFARTKILFLGWIVSKDYVMADPRRIQKVKDFIFPTSKKAVRSFLGLVNSLRRVTSMQVIAQIAILSPLTSSKAEFKPTEEHRKAFQEIKDMLISQPLFSQLIDEKAEKYLWVDAATSSGVLGAVLAQKISSQENKKFVPVHLDLEDEVHQYIYDHELKYEPAKLYTSLPIERLTPTQRKTVPPVVTPEGPLLGYTEENVVDSFFWSVISVLTVYNCTPPESTLALRAMAVKKLKSANCGIRNTKLRDFVFKMNFDKHKEYLQNFLRGTVGVDPEFLLVEAMAIALMRPIIVISSLKRHKAKPVLNFNSDKEMPPIILGVYERQGIEIFKPFFLNKNVEFNLDSLKDRVQIVAYVAKTIPEAFLSRPILDLEVFAILTSLYSLQRYISGVKVKLLTDSRVLYYLFSAKVGNSSVKIKRWCLKLLSDYPLVTLHFVRTTDNLADFLTREGLPSGDLEKFNLKDVQISDFYDELPKPEFTLAEWIEFVEKHPEYLTINRTDKPSEQSTIMALTSGLSNVKDVVTPLEILKERLQRSEIVQNQKKEFPEIYAACLASKDFEFLDEKDPKQVKYKLVSDLLMVEKNFYKILVPDSMIGILLSHTHLLGHKGLVRMMADLESYWFKNMYTVTKKFVTSCYSCFLSYKGKRKQKLGVYPTPSRPFQEVTMDLAENLNKSGGYSHLLVLQCTFSDFVIIIPLKSKTSTEISRVLLHSVLMQYNVEKIHSDNGPGFRSAKWLEVMAALGITVITTSALHPAGRGQVERLVGTVKILMKKILATRPTLDWEYIPFLVAKILNNTTSPKTGFKPSAMVYGRDGAGAMFLDSENTAPPNHFVKTHRTHIEQVTAEIRLMTDVATERLTQLRMITNERVNQNRTAKVFKPGDYVFVLDRTVVPGAARVLRTRLSPSPYVVVRPLWTTTLVKRLGDGFTSLYSNSDLKLYEGSSPLFSTLPVEVSKVLLHSFSDLLDSDLTTLTRVDPLTLPTAVTLFEPDSPDTPTKVTGEGEESREELPSFTPLDEGDIGEPMVKDEPKEAREPNPEEPMVMLDPLDPMDEDDPDVKDTLKAAAQEQVEADVQVLLKDENIEGEEDEYDSEEDDDDTLEVIPEVDEGDENPDESDNLPPKIQTDENLEQSVSEPRRSSRKKKQNVRFRDDFVF